MRSGGGGDWGGGRGGRRAGRGLCGAAGGEVRGADRGGDDRGAGGGDLWDLTVKWPQSYACSGSTFPSPVENPFIAGLLSLSRFSIPIWQRRSRKSAAWPW